MANCSSQMCGVHHNDIQSVAIFKNKHYELLIRNCDDVFLQPVLPYNPPPYPIRPTDAAEDILVSCNYEKKTICQYPLLSTMEKKDLEVKIDDKLIDIQSTLSIIRKWETNDVIPSEIKVELSFHKHFIVRGYYTAWNVTKISYALNKDANLDVVLGDGMYWSHVEAKGVNKPPDEKFVQVMPKLTLFPSPMVVRKLLFTMNRIPEQTIPYFEIRGCNAEDKNFLVPKLDGKETFI